MFHSTVRSVSFNVCRQASQFDCDQTLLVQHSVFVKTLEGTFNKEKALVCEGSLFIDSSTSKFLCSDDETG